MKSLFDTLNIVYGEEEKRGFVKLNAISLLFTVGGILFVVAALGAIVVIPVALKYIGLSEAADLLLRLGRWPAMFAVLTLALAVIYRYGPSCEWLLGAVLLVRVQFGKFNETYGSLGAVIGFMWISAIVILLGGAELDAEMEHQTARDTTTGSPKPMGARRTRLEPPRAGDAGPMVSKSGRAEVRLRSGGRAERTTFGSRWIAAGTESAGSSKWRVPYWLSMTIRSFWKLPRTC